MTFGSYLLQFLGCLIQSMPVALLLFLPFDKRSLWISGKKLSILIGVFLIIYAFIFSAYIGVITPLYSAVEVQDKANIATFIGLLIFSVFGLVNIRAGRSAKLLILLVDIYYEALIYTLSALVIHQILFDSLSGQRPYTVYNVCTLFILTAATAPFVWKIMKVKLRDILAFMDNRQLERSCVYMGIELALYCIFIFLMPSFDGVNALLSILCYAVGNALALYSFLGEVHMVKQQAEIEEKMRMIDTEYGAIQNNIEEMAVFRHDMRHHFGVIATLNNEGRTKELNNYLQNYVKAYESFESEKLCAWPLVDTILKYYAEKCRREKIQIKTAVNVRADLGINPADMTVLLGNCLENAINSCRQVADRNKYIYVDMMKVRGSFLIYVENVCLKMEGVCIPHKENSERRHGYGTESIRKIAEKYDGSVEFKRENEVFMTKILLNL